MSTSTTTTAPIDKPGTPANPQRLGFAQQPKPGDATTTSGDKPAGPPPPR